ncbi:MAG: AbrB/MazE/SpoVT family DNA-binding domain-containing protein [Planctomycetes bacterium]|nr:AbrB/MazE/SpoVT family DNA-binding domain-containing protein [Planctomycetota bacterium]
MTKIQRWGNSFGLRIPRSLARDVGVAAGMLVDLKIEDGHLVLTPRLQKRYQLDDLLAQVTRKNVHAEVSAAGPQGHEVW